MKAFDVTLLSLVGVAALGLRQELAIGLWVTVLIIAVQRMRRDREQVPRAVVIDG